MHSFKLERPATLDEALAMLAADDEARPLAGGMTLIPAIKQRLAMPPCLVDLSQIQDLRGVRIESGHLRVGAMTRHADLAASPDVARHVPGLAALAGVIADRQVRNRGTMGGSISNNDPGADYPAALVGLGAAVVTTRRRLDAEDFFVGMFETALEPGELVVAIEFPLLACNYVKYRSKASGYAVAGVFVARHADGVRVAVTGAGPCVFRWPEAERALAADFRAEALEGLALDPADMSGDLHHSAAHKAQLALVCARRAVEGFAARNP